MLHLIDIMPILAEGEQMGEQNQFLAQLIMWGPIVLIVVLIIRPHGLLGRKTAEKV